MNSQHSSNPEDQNPGKRALKRKQRKRGFLGGLFVGGLLGALLTFVVGATAHFDDHRGRHFGSHAPGMLSERAEFATAFMLKKLDATDAQREQINAIVQETIAELQPLMSEHRSTRDAMREILEQPYIDRDALETLRVATLQSADTASKRMVQGVADTADVLTQEQRLELLALKERFRR